MLGGRTAILLSFVSIALSQSASAATVSGPSALALASVVAEHSTELKLYHKSIIARLFNGEFDVPFSANKKISIEADAIVCRASNVDITARSCRLTFGAARADLTGRKAHELYATIAEVGCRRKAQRARCTRACRTSYALFIRTRLRKRVAAAQTVRLMLAHRPAQN